MPKGTRKLADQHNKRRPRKASRSGLRTSSFLSGFYFKALVSQPAKYFASCGCAATMAR